MSKQAQQDKITENEAKASATLQPVLFLSHGAGPCWFMDDGFENMNSSSAAAKWYREVAKEHIPVRPTAILVISAHWETSNELRVSSVERNTLLYDYSGFPSNTYELKYPAPGSPTLANDVVKLLDNHKGLNGVKTRLETNRGLDHGVFIPLLLVYPDASIPVVQLSLHDSLDPALHVEIGRALAPLRARGVLILGSGQATHGRGGPRGYGVKFDRWLADVLTTSSYSAAQRCSKLINYSTECESSRYAHARPEHLVPVFACAGAAGGSVARKIYDGFPTAEMSLGSFLFP